MRRGRGKKGGTPHAAIATLICVGCVALKDDGYDLKNFFLKFMLIFVYLFVDGCRARVDSAQPPTVHLEEPRASGDWIRGSGYSHSVSREAAHARRDKQSCRDGGVVKTSSGGRRSGGGGHDNNWKRQRDR